MKAKKYTLIMLTFLCLFVLYHTIVWFSITKNILMPDEKYYLGDLNRMSYINGMITYRSKSQDFKKRHFTYSNNIKGVDMITIGDSFSNGNAKGPNRYYQDYIASKYDLDVLNIQPVKEGFIETILLLNKVGFLDKVKPKYILIESVERYAIERLSRQVNWHVSADNDYVLEKSLKKQYNSSSPKGTIINKSNYNALLYNILYRYDDNAFFSKTHLLPLDDDYFSSEIKNKLLFYYEDIHNLNKSGQLSITRLNENLNKLSGILKEKNIELIFLPAVDKYNLYSNHIINNPYSESVFFEQLRMQDKRYRLIDTKLILSKLIEDGVKDVYYSDDTHWSNIGSEAIIQQLFK